jgi:hypothetical protein
MMMGAYRKLAGRRQVVDGFISNETDCSKKSIPKYITQKEYQKKKTAGNVLRKTCKGSVSPDAWRKG